MKPASIPESLTLLSIINQKFNDQIFTTTRRKRPPFSLYNFRTFREMYRNIVPGGAPALWHSGMPFWRILIILLFLASLFRRRNHKTFNWKTFRVTTLLFRQKSSDWGCVQSLQQMVFWRRHQGGPRLSWAGVREDTSDRRGMSEADHESELRIPVDPDARKNSYT